MTEYSIYLYISEAFSSSAIARHASVTHRRKKQLPQISMDCPRRVQPVQPQILIDWRLARRIPVRQIRASTPFPS